MAGTMFLICVQLTLSSASFFHPLMRPSEKAHLHGLFFSNVGFIIYGWCHQESA